MSRGPIRALLSLALVLSFSCDESLPPYVAPTNLFTGTIRPTFIQNSGGGQLWVTLTVQNTFDETLQDVPSLKGSLEIVLARDPGIHKTVTLESKDLLYHYNALLGYPINANIPNLAGGVLTIDPKDSVRFFYSWNFMSDDSVYLPKQVFQMHEDPKYPGNFMADPETIILKGSMQMFTKTGLVTFSPVSYVLNYYLPAS